MAGGQSSGGGFVGGVGQNIIANICASIFGGACVGLGAVKNDKLEDISNWPFWLLLAGLFLLAVFGINTIRLTYKQWRARARIAPPRSDRVGIIVAQIVGDTAENGLQRTICEALIKELGQAADVLAWGEQLVVGTGRADESELAATRDGQKWLKAKESDLLIWGRAVTQNVVSLRFLVREHTTTTPNSYVLTDKFELPIEMVSAVGAAIAARAISMLPTNHGSYVVPVMRTVVTRLQRIVQQIPVTFSADTRGALLHVYAIALQTIGLQTGEAQPLLEAISVHRAALKERTRDRVPLDWATTQTYLGDALFTLGERESGTERLEEAVAAYRAALEERTRDRVPLDWAMTLGNLGNALWRIGEREEGLARLQEAATAHRAVLEERTRDRVPAAWASTQNNLANVLTTLGERESGTERLEEAVAAYRAALEEFTQGQDPLAWAMAQNNLGAVLNTLGERESGTERLEEAVAAYRAALEELTQDRVPLEWATTQTHLGDALFTLGERESRTDFLEEAVAAYRAALEELTQERVPRRHETAQVNLANCLVLLKELRGSGNIS